MADSLDPPASYAATTTVDNDRILQYKESCTKNETASCSGGRTAATGKHRERGRATRKRSEKPLPFTMPSSTSVIPRHMLDSHVLYIMFLRKKSQMQGMEAEDRKDEQT